MKELLQRIDDLYESGQMNVALTANGTLGELTDLSSSVYTHNDDE